LSYLSKIHRSQRKEASDLATFKAGNVRLIIQAASAAARKRTQPDLRKQNPFEKFQVSLFQSQQGVNKNQHTLAQFFV